MMEATAFKNELMRDLKICTSYQPDEDLDFLCMTERYQKERKNRAVLRENMKRLLDGKPYENPFTVYEGYGEAEIAALELALETYIQQMPRTRNPVQLLEKTIHTINALQEKSGGHMIDGWRAQRMDALLLVLAKKVHVKQAQSKLAMQKVW